MTWFGKSCGCLLAAKSANSISDLNCGDNKLSDNQFLAGPKHDAEANVVGHWPWMSSIGYYENDEWIHQCGATLISTRHFLTAAHCVDGHQNWQIHIGDFDFSLPRSDLRGIDLQMKKIKIHPKHQEKSPYYDLAVIETDYVKFSDVIYPICLPTDPNKNRDDDLVTLLGWGSSTAHGKSSKLLQRVSLTLFSNEHCNETHIPRGDLYSKIKNFVPNLFPSHLACAGLEDGRHGACKGDSGGPLQIRNTTTHRYYQVAIVHGALECGNPSFPGVYVRLENPEILSFIRSAMESEWHLIVDVDEKKMELFNWKTRKQCLMTETPPTSGFSNYKLEMIGTDDAAILCATEEESFCYKFLTESKVWKSLPRLPKASRVKLVAIPGRGVGLFHFYSTDTLEVELLRVYLLDKTDAKWTKIFESELTKSSRLLCVAQLNETTTVIIRSNLPFETFDWSTKQYTEHPYLGYLVDGNVEECAVIEGLDGTPEILLTLDEITKGTASLASHRASYDFKGKMHVTNWEITLGKIDQKLTQIVPINGGRDLLFYSSPNYQLPGSSSDSDEFDGTDIIWKFNVKSFKVTQIGRMLNNPRRIQVVPMYGIECP